MHLSNPDFLPTSLLKRPLSSTPSNYTQISHLAFMAKPLEKVVGSQLTAHLSGNDLFDGFQSGVTSKRSLWHPPWTSERVSSGRWLSGSARIWATEHIKWWLIIKLLRLDAVFHRDPYSDHFCVHSAEAYEINKYDHKPVLLIYKTLKGLLPISPYLPVTPMDVRCYLDTVRQKGASSRLVHMPKKGF